MSFTDGVAPLQLATSGAAVLGVGSVVILHDEARGCLGNRGSSPVEGRGWHQSRGETLAGDVHRLRLLLQSARWMKETDELETSREREFKAPPKTSPSNHICIPDVDVTRV